METSWGSIDIKNHGESVRIKTRNHGWRGLLEIKKEAVA